MERLKELSRKWAIKLFPIELTDEFRKEIEEYTKECISHNLERVRLETNSMHTEIAKSNLPMEYYTPISNRINDLKKNIVKDDNIVLL